MVVKTPMPMCPMAEICKGMMEKRGSGLWIMIPGIVFIAVGILIFLYPQILAWLIAVVFIAVGFVMLLMIRFMRGIGKRRQTQSD